MDQEGKRGKRKGEEERKRDRLARACSRAADGTPMLLQTT